MGIEMTIKYQFLDIKNCRNIFILVLLGLAVHYGTRFYDKPKPNIQALDLAVANAVLDAGRAYCKSIKARNFLARGDGSSVQSGCVR